MSLFLNTLDSFKDLREMEKNFDRLLPSITSELSLADFTPAVNTREGDYAFHIEVDLPGVKKKDISVEVKDHLLKISGKRKTKKEVKEQDYHRVESSYGSFERSFRLPDNIDAENVKASCEEGVLEVVLPKLDGKQGGKQVKVT